jgi:cytosine/adenosine deaminase-related metal-dependent hydrolase
LAHCVHVGAEDIGMLAGTGTGAAWCPTSNMRLGSGFAPGREMLDAGVGVGLAVDGSASNDSGNLLAEARQAFLTTRGRLGPSSLTAREALSLATRGGAQCLGRDDIGTLEVGKRADIALFAVDGLAYRGAESDPVASLIFCNPGRVQHLFVDGNPVVHEGQLVNLSEASLIWA